MLSIGTLLQNRYRIVRVIASGGMGTVYLAEDVRLPGRQCAVKEMNPARVLLQNRNWAIQMFRREAGILACLKHRGLAAVTDFFAEGGNWYLVMDYVEGQTLDEVLDTAHRNRLPEPVALDIFRQLCDVLEYLHGQTPPVIFRDLKPGNVMITPEGEVKLIDFGIARYFQPGRPQDTMKLGTPGYAAPEQCSGQSQSDARSDIYALGVLLHQMLTGHDPTLTPRALLPPARSLNSDIRPEVEQAILMAIHPQPVARYQRAGDFYQALLPAPPRVSTRAGLPWRVTVVAGVLGLGAILVSFIVASVFAWRYIRSRPVPATSVPVMATPQPPLASATPHVVAPSPGTGAFAGAATSLPPTDTPLPTSTMVPTPMPTPTPVPTRTPIPSPTPCGVSVYSKFTSVWRETQDLLGCPARSARTNQWIAEEPFKRGRMFWRQDTDQHYVLYGSGQWERFPNRWFEGMPTYTCGTQQNPPTPLRGFGAVWCTYERVRDGIGNATAGEWGEYGTVQDFVNGSLIIQSGSGTYVLYADGGWERR